MSGSIKLYNGDCLDILKEIPDNSVDLVLTDPPYDIKNTKPGKSSLTDKIKKNMGDLENSNICNGFNLQVLDELVRINSKINMYFFCNKAQIPMYFNYFLPLGCSFDIIKWVKTNPVPAYCNKYITDTEYCLYFRKGGRCMPQNYEDGKTLYQAPINAKDKKKYGHPTCKPIPLLEKIIRNSTEEGYTVIDPFMGSGSTGEACQNIGVNFIGIELMEKWYNVAKERIAGTKRQNKEQLKLF